MDLLELVPAILVNLLFQTPLYVVWIAGIIIAVMNRQRYPQAAGLIIIALALVLVSAMVQSVLNIYLPATLLRSNGATATGSVLAGVNGVFMLINVAVWIMVLVAVFRRRGTD